jgi:hypothetical protein
MGRLKGVRSMRFRAVLELGGKTATGIAVPDDVVTGLGSGRRPAVSVTINGYTYRSTVASMGGRFMLPVSAEVRQQSGVAAGDEVDVEVSLDTLPREVVVPSDLAAALAADPVARAAFDGLAYTHRREWVRSVEDAKKPETRVRRVAKVIAELSK